MSSTKHITALALLSYPHIAEMQPGENGKAGKYSCALVFTPELLALPGEQARFVELKKLAIEAINAKWPGKADALMKSDSFKKGFRNDWELKGYPVDSVFINARTTRKPGVVYAWAGPDGKPVNIPEDKIKDEMYAGAVVRASLSVFAFDKEGSKGVSFSLNNLQKIRDGERIDGRVAAENEFTADLNAVPASLEDLI